MVNFGPIELPATVTPHIPRAVTWTEKSIPLGIMRFATGKARGTRSRPFLDFLFTIAPKTGGRQTPDRKGPRPAANKLR